MFANTLHMVMTEAIDSAKGAEKKRLIELYDTMRKIQSSKAERDVAQAIREGKCPNVKLALAIVDGYKAPKTEPKASKGKTDSKAKADSKGKVESRKMTKQEVKDMKHVDKVKKILPPDSKPKA